LAFGRSGDAFRLDAERVVDGAAQFPFAPEVPFRRLDRHVSKEELDLIQLAAREVVESSAGANVTGLAVPVCDHSVFLSLLDRFEREAKSSPRRSPQPISIASIA
jgi:hypothetical protein